MPINKQLNAERVRELLDYDPVTGALDWINPTERSPREGGKAGAVGRSGSKYQFRRFIQIDNDRYPAHRVVWLHVHGGWPKGFLVPRNGNYDDLRLENFDDLSASEAARRGGPRRTNTSGYRGVTWAKDKQRWLAYITHNYKKVFIGYYKTKEEAISARDKFAADLGAVPVLDKDQLEAKSAAVTRDARLRVMWRKVQRQTNGITKWPSYEAFVADIKDVPPANGKKLILVPIRDQETIGPGNFLWKTIDSPWDYKSVEGRRAYKQAHRDNNRSNYRDKNLREKFGISLIAYERMLAEQSNVCACCTQPETTKRHGKLLILAVDHCHTTGAIRGLLCNNCNQGLGQFRDDPNLLRKAADYLDRHAIKTKHGAASPQTPIEERKAHHGNYSP